MKLQGIEKVFWAAGGQTHQPESMKPLKNLVNGDLRRETNRPVFEIEQQLYMFTRDELERNGFKVNTPFCVPLPADLPPSFFYAGEMMSRFSIEYKMTAMLIGLTRARGGSTTATGGGVPQGQLIIQQAKQLFVRAYNAVPPVPITKTSEAQISGTFGLFGKGSSKVEG